MKAVRIHQHGGPETLKVEDLPDPKCEEHDHVVVQMKAASVNHLDLWVRQGIRDWKIPLPIIPGSDGAGIVTSTGPGVKDLRAGDKILVVPNVSCGTCSFCQDGWDTFCPQYGILGENLDGCDAELVCFSRRNIIPMPKHLSFEEAASIPLVFMSAWSMLVTKAKVKPEDFVLVWAAGSGVGSAAIQIAKLFGANVIATAGTEEKMQLAKALGADYVLNHYKDKISEKVLEITENHGADVVMEHIGDATWKESLKSMAKGGRLATCGSTSGHKVEINLRHLFMKQQTILGSTMATRGELFEIIHFVRQKKLKPVVDRIFPLSEVANAHKYMEEKKHFGKIVLAINS